MHMLLFFLLKKGHSLILIPSLFMPGMQNQSSMDILVSMIPRWHNPLSFSFQKVARLIDRVNFSNKEKVFLYPANF